MRQFNVYAVLLILLGLSSCKSDLVEVGQSAKGEVIIALSATDARNDVKLRSTVEVPEIGDFEVEIYNSRGIRLYRDTYANSVDKKIALNGGEYRLLAQHGDSAGVGFNAIYFAADEPFTVEGQKVMTVTSVARMAKVMATVEYGPYLKEDYKEYYSRLRMEKKPKKYLEFSQNEKRPGYISAGSLIYEFYAKVNGEWKYYPAPAVEYAPNDFVQFTVEVNRGTGALQLVTIVLDKNAEMVEKTIEIPLVAAPNPGPQLSVDGFDANNSYIFYEGVRPDDFLQANIVSKVGIETCELNIDSPYLAAKGVPSSIELTTIDDATKDILKEAGFRWVYNMKGKTLANFDFAAVPEHISYTDAADFSATVSLKVTDKEGKSAQTEAYTISIAKADMTLFAYNHNAYARSIRGVTGKTITGNPEKVMLEYSKDGMKWSSVAPASVSGLDLTYPNISGLEPSTTYQLRLAHGTTYTDVISLTTEAAAQFPNSGFEDWTTQVHSCVFKKVIIGGGGTVEYDWYQPWGGASAQFWAMNSKKTMPSETTNLTLGDEDYRYVKCLPVTSYSTKANSGQRSAHIYSVNVDGANTTWNAQGSTVIAGELFVGTVDASGNHTSEGRSFGSRPDRLKFKYMYAPVEGETFYFKVEFKVESGNVLFSKEITDGQASASWAEMDVPITYSDLTQKVSQVYVIFKSSSASKPEVTEGSSLELAGTNISAHFGSSLRIDDIELIYE